MLPISVFTPTHDARWLRDAYCSLLQQTYSDWEWVLSPNHGAEIPADIAGHPQVRIAPAPFRSENVGRHKLWCCQQARGEILVELDHDDVLAPNALRTIHGAAKSCRQPGHFFFHSDCYHFREAGDPSTDMQIYPPELGWEQYLSVDQQTPINSSFPDTARSLCEIWSAPNHVRAWARDTYWQAGGHSDMAVVDDHDLVCRTYLTGCEFLRCQRPLYGYRLHARQTYLLRNQDVQTTTVQIRRRYLESLAQEWCRRSQLLAIDLGGAHNSPEGYESVDLHDADHVCDVLKGLPFPDNSVGILRAVDFLEHIPREQVVGFMNECYRVLAPGGWLLTATPSSEGAGAWCDPTHASAWNALSWRYYCDREYAKYVPAVRCRFQLVDIWKEDVLMGASPSHSEMVAVPYVIARLSALKGQRQPGLCLI